jgi:hypothetical protein
VGGNPWPLVTGRWRAIARQEERMSVTSVLPGLPPSYAPLSGNNSQSARFTALAEQLRQKTTTKADGSQATRIQVNGAPQNIAVMKDGKGMLQAGYAGRTDASQFQSALARAQRADGATAGRSTSGASGSDGSKSSTGTALYKLISQMGNSDPSTSALLRSWNSIMQSGQDGGDTAAATLPAFSQNEASAFESGSLHLTA